MEGAGRRSGGLYLEMNGAVRGARRLAVQGLKPADRVCEPGTAGRLQYGG